MRMHVKAVPLQPLQLVGLRAARADNRIPLPDNVFNGPDDPTPTQKTARIPFS